MSRDVKYTLGLDAKGFSAGVKEAKAAFGDVVSGCAGGAGRGGEIASAAGPAGLALAAIGGAALAAATAVGKFALDAAEALIKTGGRLADLEAQTGISTQALQKL